MTLRFWLFQDGSWGLSSQRQTVSRAAQRVGAVIRGLRNPGGRAFPGTRPQQGLRTPGQLREAGQALRERWTKSATQEMGFRRTPP